MFLLPILTLEKKIKLMLIVHCWFSASKSCVIKEQVTKEIVWNELSFPRCMNCKIILGKINGECWWESAQGEMQSL